ncbi:hypothetical protein ACTXT7_000513 [Hymenolepis weldensis]
MKNFHQDQKFNRKMIDGCVRADPTEVPTVMHAHEVSITIDGCRSACNQSQATTRMEPITAAMEQPTTGAPTHEEEEKTCVRVRVDMFLTASASISEFHRTLAYSITVKFRINALLGCIWVIDSSLVCFFFTLVISSEIFRQVLGEQPPRSSREQLSASLQLLPPLHVRPLIIEALRDVKTP